MEMGEAFQVIGEFGCGQLYVSVVLYVIYVYGAIHFLQPVFVGRVPKFCCVEPRELRPEYLGLNLSSADPDTTDLEWNEEMCLRLRDRNCSKLKFLDEHTSIVTEWKLVCDDTFQASLSASMFMLGVFVGSCTTGSLSDHIGRRKSMFLCLILGAICSTICSFSPTLIFFITMRFVSGIFFCGLQIITFVHITEMIGPSKRAVCGTIFESGLAISSILFAGCAFLIKDWRHLTLITSSVGFLLVPLYFYIPESPRWLLTQGNHDAAEEALRWIARKNGRDITHITLRYCSKEEKNKPGNRLITLFKLRKLRNRTLILMYVWFCVLGTYYGLSMMAEDLGINFYMNILLLCLVELPALAIAMFLMNRFGRRFTISVSMLVGGLSCSTIFLVPLLSSHISHHTISGLKTGLALFGKMAVTMAMATSFIHTSELMPTMIRNGALGLCVMLGRVGSMAAPFIAKLGLVYPLLEYSVFGTMAFTAGGLCLFLSETLNRPMPETLGDAMCPTPPQLESPEKTPDQQHKPILISSDRSSYGSIN